MSNDDLDLMPQPDEYIAACPECGAKALGRLDQEPPGHLHDIGTRQQRFVAYVNTELADKPKRGPGRPRLEPVEP